MEHRVLAFALAGLAIAAVILNLARRGERPFRESSPHHDPEEMLGI